VNYYIILEDAKNCEICATVGPISTKFNTMAQNVFLKHGAENFNFKTPRWRTAAILKIEKLQYLMMIQNGSLKRDGRPPSWLFKMNF